jgi:hypothetical protein
VNDIHSHVGIDLFNYIRGRYPFTQSARDLRQKASSNGIENVVAFPMPFAPYYSPKQVIDSQLWIESGIEEYPYQVSNRSLIYEASLLEEHKLLPFLTFDPRRKVPEQVESLRFLIQNHDIYGLKLHTIATWSNPQVLIKSEFIEILEDFDIPLLIHTGLSPEFTHARYVLDVARIYPSVRILIAHAAAFDVEILKAVRDSENLYIDCTPLLTLCQFATQNDHQHIAEKIFPTNYSDPVRVLVDLNDFMQGRLVWGTDEPWTSTVGNSGKMIAAFSYEQECSVLEQLAHLGYSDTKQDIAVNNTRSFLFG